MSPTQELEHTQVVPSPLTSATSSPGRSPTPTPRPRRRNTNKDVSPLPPSDVPVASFSTVPETQSQLLNDFTMADASSAADDNMMLGRSLDACNSLMDVDRLRQIWRRNKCPGVQALRTQLSLSPWRNSTQHMRPLWTRMVRSRSQTANAGFR